MTAPRPLVPSFLAGAVLAATALLAVGSPQAAAQEIRGINGSWERYPNIASGLGSDTSGQAPPAPAPIPNPPLKPELLDAWRAETERIRELTQAGLPPTNSNSACLPEGMPSMMQAIFPMEILETPGQITVIQEAYNQVRRIHLNEELVGAQDAEPRFSGHSVGRWDGDTLVVETVGVKDYVRFRLAPHSANMRIVERIRLINRDYLQNTVTVTDPEYLTAPWTWTWMYRRWPGYKLQEYVCEDNRYYQDPERGYQRLRIETPEQ